MKVAFVQPCPQFGGSPISGLVSVQALLDAGHQVDAIFASDGPFVDRYRDVGCNVTVIPHTNWLRRGSVYRHARRWSQQTTSTKAFVDFFELNRPELVLNNTIVSYASAKAATQVGVPCLWHIRELFADMGGEMSPPPIFGKRWVHRTIDKLASKIIVNSRAVASNVLGPAMMNQAVVIPNSVPDSMFEDHPRSVAQTRQELGLPYDIPIVGVPGTLRPVKGHRFLLDTIPQITAQVKDCHFAFTGEVSDEYGRQIRELISLPEYTERCTMLGRVEAMDMFYHAVDVICVPSRSESFGRVVIEAFARHRPVVASAVGGIQEIITSEKDGILVKYGDKNQLASELIRLLTRPEISQHIAANAYVTARSKYTQSEYAKRIVQAAEETIE